MKDTDKVTLTVAQLKKLITEAKKAKQLKEDDEHETLGKYRLFINNVQIGNYGSRKDLITAAKAAVEGDKILIPNNAAKGEMNYRFSIKWKENDIWIKRIRNGETF